MASTTAFKVDGPHEVSYEKGDGKGKRIEESAEFKFWKEHPSMKDRVGCYVFAIRAGRGFMPMYVGKAAKSFKQEIFTKDKLFKYNKAIFKRGGTPVFFFLVHPTKKGGTTKSISVNLKNI